MHFREASDVVVVGSVNLDSSFTVDRLPAEGETLAGTSAPTTGGGKGANQAHAAAAAGARTALVAAVGPDAGPALEDLAAVGVELGGVVSTAVPTGRAVLLVTPGDNAIVVAPGANARLDAAAVEAWVTTHPTPRVAVIGNEVPESAVLATVEAFGAVSRLVYNPSPWRPASAAVLPRVGVVVVNSVELGQVLGDDVPASVDAVTARIVDVPGDTVVVTIGADGSVVRHDGDVVYVPAVPAEAISTVGAGDAFLGTLAAGLAQGAAVVEAVRVAAAAAARTVGSAGARVPSPAPVS
ncbi:PfkB family carbohydrate kinase [Curtobacterium sp. 22159]|uniref:PfkB family carbohydrate kinase n=1 Tax=Curtobacterium sp. 22159 TaxID=3453882 RepID=UPI003F861B01